ncbi:MAG TPA: pyridoxal phosphate-dependent aminotransferase [Bacteroidota bacterium]
MFSSRTGWNLAPNDLSRLLDEKRRKNEPIIDLTESNPTRCSFSYSRNILQALATDRSLLYEPDPRGLLSARERVAAYYGKIGLPVNPDNIILAASTSEAYTHLFRLLCNPGENVLVPKPGYPLFEYLCNHNDVEASFYRLRYDDEWQIDFESLQNAFDQSTRAILLVHPNNPTGSFIKPLERQRIVDFARQNNLALIVDEVFSEFSLTEVTRQRSFAAEENVLTFTLNGISKMLGLPQMKLAWLTASGGADVVREAVRRLEFIADTYLSVGTPIQQALPTLLDDGGNVTAQITNRIRTNREKLSSALTGLPASLYNADAGWNAILRLPGIKSDEAWALDILRGKNVLVHPGHFFEMEQESSVVVSLLPPQAVFTDGIGGILDAVQ